MSASSIKNSVESENLSANEEPAPKPTSASNTDDVHGRLREMLLNGELAPGASLSQLKLAQQLGVSTTPLREAMRLLQAEGLLIAEHNRRPRVAPLDPSEIDAVYGSRILIEALAIQLTVPQLTESDIEDLQTDLAEMSQAAEDQDLAAWEPVHKRFHGRLIQGADEALLRVISPFADRSERYRRMGLYHAGARTWEIGNDEHEAIVLACKAGDPREASVLLARHLARSAFTVLTKIAPEENPSVARAALRLVQGTKP